MIRKTEKSVIKTAYGKVLPEPLEYEFSWDDFEKYGEVVEAKEEIPQSEAIEIRNGQHKANARQEAWTARLLEAGVKPPDKSEPQELLKSVFKSLMLDKRQNYTVAQARAKAAAFLNTEWED